MAQRTVISANQCVFYCAYGVVPNSYYLSFTGKTLVKKTNPVLLSDDKIQLSLHQKPSFKLPTIICVIQGTTKQDQKIICPSSLTTIYIFPN